MDDDRKWIRLYGYDYRASGPYFVTICTRNAGHLLGAIQDGIVRVSAIGAMVQAEWLDLPSMHGGIRLDAHVVMPNHFHGILVLPGVRRDGLDDLLLPGEAGPSLASVTARFKSRTSRRARRGHALPLRSLWQRGYFEHIIRDERAFLAIRQYIADNAKTWANDVLNPEHPRHWMFRR